MSNKINKITKDMTIAEVIEVDERLQDILAGFGMHCFTCPMCSMETLEEASEVHEIDLDLMLKKLNEFLEKKDASED